MDPIRVYVVSLGPKRNYLLRYRAPDSGKRVHLTSRTKDKELAESRALELEEKLNSGAYSPPEKVLWHEFRKRFLADADKRLCEKSVQKFCTAANHFERIVHPERLHDVTKERVAFFQNELRKEGLSEPSIGGYMASIRAAFTWAETVGLLDHPIKMLAPRMSVFEMSFSDLMKKLTRRQLEGELAKLSSRVKAIKLILRAKDLYSEKHDPKEDQE